MWRCGLVLLGWDPAVSAVFSNGSPNLVYRTPHQNSLLAHSSCSIPHCFSKSVPCTSPQALTRPHVAPEIQVENHSWPRHRLSVSVTSWVGVTSSLVADHNVSWASGFQAGVCVWFYGSPASHGWQEECTSIVHAFCGICSDVGFPSPLLHTAHSWLLCFRAPTVFICRNFGVHQAFAA